MRRRSVSHYRERAEQLRNAARAMDDEVARLVLLDLAQQYDGMAAERVGHDGADGAGKPDGGGADKDGRAKPWPNAAGTNKH